MSIQTEPALLPFGDERDEVTSWRIERLVAAGYDGEAALVLALDRDVDLHLAVSLLERGCPSDTALQILF
jgi:hypothetical protein